MSSLYNHISDVDNVLLKRVLKETYEAQQYQYAKSRWLADDRRRAKSSLVMEAAARRPSVPRLRVSTAVQTDPRKQQRVLYARSRSTRKEPIARQSSLAADAVPKPEMPNGMRAIRVWPRGKTAVEKLRGDGSLDSSCDLFNNVARDETREEARGESLDRSAFSRASRNHSHRPSLSVERRPFYAETASTAAAADAAAAGEAALRLPSYSHQRPYRPTNRFASTESFFQGSRTVRTSFSLDREHGMSTYHRRMTMKRHLELQKAESKKDPPIVKRQQPFAGHVAEPRPVRTRLPINTTMATMTTKTSTKTTRTATKATSKNKPEDGSVYVSAHGVTHRHLASAIQRLITPVPPPVPAETVRTRSSSSSSSSSNAKPARPLPTDGLQRSFVALQSATGALHHAHGVDDEHSSAARKRSTAPFGPCPEDTSSEWDARIQAAAIDAENLQNEQLQHDEDLQRRVASAMAASEVASAEAAAATSRGEQARLFLLGRQRIEMDKAEKRREAVEKSVKKSARRARANESAKAAAAAAAAAASVVRAAAAATAATLGAAKVPEATPLNNSTGVHDNRDDVLIKEIVTHVRRAYDDVRNNQRADERIDGAGWGDDDGNSGFLAVVKAQSSSRSSSSSSSSNSNNSSSVQKEQSTEKEESGRDIGGHDGGGGGYGDSYRSDGGGDFLAVVEAQSASSDSAPKDDQEVGDYKDDDNDDNDDDDNDDDNDPPNVPVNGREDLAFLSVVEEQVQQLESKKSSSSSSSYCEGSERPNLPPPLPSIGDSDHAVGDEIIVRIKGNACRALIVRIFHERLRCEDTETGKQYFAEAKDVLLSQRQLSSEEGYDAALKLLIGPGKKIAF